MSRSVSNRYIPTITCPNVCVIAPRTETLIKCSLIQFLKIPITVIDTIAPPKPIQNGMVNDLESNPTKNTLKIVTSEADLNPYIYKTMTVTIFANPIFAPGTGMTLIEISMTFKTIATAISIDNVVILFKFFIQHHQSHHLLLFQIR